MLPTNNQSGEDPGDSRCLGTGIGGGALGSECVNQGAGGGAHEVSASEEAQGDNQETGESGLPETVSPNGGASSGEGDQVDKQTSEDAGNSRTGYEPGSPAIPREAFRKAVIVAGGNISIIASAIGRSAKSVRDRIASNPELNALYGSGKSPNKTSKMTAMKRRESDIPDDPEPEAEVNIELVEQVAEMDREAYRAALKQYGVSDRQLNKLKALDGLAKNGGRLLSVSLQMTHQNYVGQLHNLAEVADELKDRMSGNVMQDGSIQPLDIEEHSSLARAYIECVKEAGKGYSLMMAGTEAMVRMMAAARSGNAGAQPKAVSGWGPMKKVREG